MTLSTLMLEIMLTRIFSVTMWYHFAFLAISIAMFGMAVGALIVYLRPGDFPEEGTKASMSLFATLFGISVVVSIVALLTIPFTERATVGGLSSMAATYLAASIPFVLSGVCVALALTRFPERVGSLYAVDLTGAALGCILLIWMLDATDGPNTVLFAAAFAALGGLLFAIDADNRKLRMRAGAALGALVLLLIANTTAVWLGGSPLHLSWVKGRAEEQLLFEKWNSYSRISVSGDPDAWVEPFGWGMSPEYVPRAETRQLRMNIDASASTELTAFDGDVSAVDYLRYDISNLAHYMRRDADVLVVGSGGGRDILAALVFFQNSVTGVEINRASLAAANGVFGEFTGHLDQHPRVSFVNDEARSFIARREQPVDIIQISLIDTWAATAAGAFALSENSLYTVEAWSIFLDKLEDDGILTVTRWFNDETPVEVYRLTALANESLRRRGVEDPRDHMLLIRRRIESDAEDRPEGVGTMLVSPSPFSARDLGTIEATADQLGFEMALSPTTAADEMLETLASSRDISEVASTYAFDISAPTDNRPFFFHVLRLRDFFRRDMWQMGKMSFNAKAVGVLGGVTVVVLGLTILCIVVPLFLAAHRPSRRSLPLFVFFASIGMGFMLVEIAQMQRIIVMLGHPTYALSVVLFSVLVSGGIGSGFSGRIKDEDLARTGPVLIGILVAMIVGLALATPAIAARFESATTLVRVAVAVAILVPLGLFMGTAFPMGMRIASRTDAKLTPWLWGINGATSVCASVFAIVIALSWGISAGLWTGAAFYLSALVTFFVASRQQVAT